MNKGLWETIVVVHNTNKALFIWCEENGIHLKSFLQPNNELKNAWEHVVRAKANELGIGPEPTNLDYIKANLDKVLGHEYRAFFDICDWLSMNLRKRVIDHLGPYDNETINAVIPRYYTEIRPKTEQLCNEIAKLRTSKDIAREDDIIKHVHDYNAIISKLIEDLTNISTSIPALEEHKAKKRIIEKRSEVKFQRWDVIKLIFAAVVGAAVSLFGKWLYDSAK